MVDGLLDPLNIYIIALGAGFLLPLLARVKFGFVADLFLICLVAMTAIATVGYLDLSQGAAARDIYTAGIEPPFAINLRYGLYEAFFVFAVNLTGLLGGWYLLERIRDKPGVMSLFLILIMGITGMVMTRDLFNLFIFVEITAIATYGLIGFGGTGKGLAAGFKYVVATTIASSFLLLGTMLIYHLVGTLNIDDMVAQGARITGPIAVAGTALVLTGILIELKPYPANGWGLDVYETAPSGVASIISVGVSAGALFALYKVLPLAEGFLPLIAAVGGLTFVVSNVIGLRQENAKRLLGYSSIGQMGLLTLALALLYDLGRTEVLALVVGGLFINHLLAKAGLFWLAGLVGRENIRDWGIIRSRTICLIAFGLLIVALVGLPPFPGFWAKWELIMQLGADQSYAWIGLILLGSLLEAAYLFRWFGHALKREDEAAGERLDLPLDRLIPVLLFSVLLYVGGYYVATHLEVALLTSFLPIYAGLAFLVLDGLPGRLKGGLLVLLLAAYAVLLFQSLTGIGWLFGLIFIAGSCVLTIGALHRGDARRGFYPLLAMMVLSLGSLVQASTSLEFFFAWEIMTISSYLLITLGRDADHHILPYLLFSLGSAFFLLTGFAVIYGATGSLSMTELGAAGDAAPLALALLAIGFLIKMGAFGVHVWLPGAYAESEDDFSAVLSAVVSKAGVFGLLVVALALGAGAADTGTVLYVLSWLGLLTAFFGALMALFQEDVKKLLAYSSMGQVGYIVAALSVGSHLGAVTASYLAINHLLFKGLLFLAIAGVIYRTGTRLMYKMGGMIDNMPLSFVGVLVAIITMSGVPPLTGFGGKWLLFNAFIEKGWYWQAGLAFFASAVAFLYLFRLIHSVFLGQRKLEHKDVREASWWLIVPQFILIGVIMAFSVYPRWLIEPLSAAVVEYYPSTLEWVGTVARTGLGYWDGFLIMNIVAGVFGVPLLILLFLSRFMRIQRVSQFNIVYAAERPETPQTTHYAYNFYPFYDKSLGVLVRPRATAFWNGVSEWAHTVGGGCRVFYTGNGQTYALFIMMYLLVLYFTAA